MVRFPSTEAGSFFFHPLQFHLQSPDLFVQVFFARRLLALPTLRSSIEYRGSLFQQLSLPLAYLVGMHSVFASQLVDRSISCGCCESHLKLERGAVVIAWLFHLLDPPRTWCILLRFFHLSPWSSFRGQLYHGTRSRRQGNSE